MLGRTTVGKGSKIFPSAVIGGDSQSVHHSAVDTTLTIGENCTIREGVTMNTGTVEHGGATVIGDNNLFLAYAHVAHDCRLGNNIILSNNVMLAGHVTVGDRAILGGGCGSAPVHPHRTPSLYRRSFGRQLRCHPLWHAERKSRVC